MDRFTEMHNDYLDPDIHDPSADQESQVIGADPEMAKLLDETFGREGISGWKKSVYRGTDCGAWLELVDSTTIKMGSIVEGVDECAEIHELTFPFTGEQVWEALEAIEADCERIWNETHGCPDCYESLPDETTYFMFTSPVNPECKSCGGKGISI